VAEEPEAAPTGPVVMTASPPPDAARRPAAVVGQAAPLGTPAAGGLRTLFRNVTGGGLMRRQLPEPAPVAPRLEPEPVQFRQPSRQAPQQDEMGLDIPAFLRRQAN
jgi:cell division protein FtsZ